jgi:hypothetical protein
MISSLYSSVDMDEYLSILENNYFLIYDSSLFVGITTLVEKNKKLTIDKQIVNSLNTIEINKLINKSLKHIIN